MVRSRLRVTRPEMGKEAGTAGSKFGLSCPICGGPLVRKEQGEGCVVCGHAVRPLPRRRMSSVWRERALRRQLRPRQTQFQLS